MLRSTAKPRVKNLLILLLLALTSCASEEVTELPEENGCNAVPSRPSVLKASDRDQSAPTEEATKTGPVVRLTETEVTLLQSFDEGLLRDLVRPDVQLDKALFLTYIAGSSRFLVSDDGGDSSLLGSKVTFTVTNVALPISRPRIRFSFSAKCVIGKYGTRDELMVTQEAGLLLALKDGTPFRPRTHLARVSDSGSFQATTPAESHVAWVWWPSGLGTIGLATAISSAGPVGVFSATDRILIHEQAISIDFTDTTRWGATGISSFSDLVWWRIGSYIGVSAGQDPRAVLLLVDSLVFRYRTIEVTVKRVDGETGVQLDVRTYQLPLVPAESGD